jgi:hypothetical protein
MDVLRANNGTQVGPLQWGWIVPFRADRLQPALNIEKALLSHD